MDSSVDFVVLRFFVTVSWIWLKKIKGLPVIFAFSRCPGGIYFHATNYIYCYNHTSNASHRQKLWYEDHCPILGYCSWLPDQTTDVRWKLSKGLQYKDDMPGQSVVKVESE